MSIRGSHQTKGCFSGCRTPQCRGALVWPRAMCMSHSSVRWAQVSLGWSAWGEFGLRTSCPEWTEDTRGVPWCHRGMPVTRTMLQCNHSQSGGIHEFIPAQGIRKQTTSVHYLSKFLDENLFLWNQKYFETLFGLLNTSIELWHPCVKRQLVSTNKKYVYLAGNLTQRATGKVVFD